MSITEIEAVVDRLSLPEQEQLLRHLQANLRRGESSSDYTSRETWMQRLDALRNSIGSRTVNLSSEQILTESRGE
ncbi:MAG TPA: hypothetical protein VGG19_08630 [Tepidisphaeraceae bacterium]